MMLLSQLYSQYYTLLQKLGKNPRSLEVIMRNLLQLSKEDFMLNFKDILLSELQHKELEKNIKRLISGEPLAYIVQYQDFWKNRFFINNNVLIPRQDSETLIETILKYFLLNTNISFLDIGCGSGCLVLSLLQEYKKSFAVALDISNEACYVSKINAKNMNLTDQITIINSSIEAYETSNKYDFIVSNPPYIALEDKDIEESVKNYEPHVALFAKDNGLYFYKEILKKGHTLLKKNGYIFFEIGYNQSEVIKNSKEAHNYKHLETVQDINKKDRVIVFQGI